MTYSPPSDVPISGTLASDLTSQTATTVIVAQTGTRRVYLRHVTVTNSHATTGTVVKILDGATTVIRLYAAAAGGGFALSFPDNRGLQGSQASAWKIQCETNSSAVQCFMEGYTSWD